jgi:L-arabinokinase
MDAHSVSHHLRQFLDNSNEWLQTEVKWLRLNQFKLVYLDAPFLPAFAAKMAQIPCCLVTNFSFDSIFASLFENYSDEDMTLPIQKMIEMYSCSDLLIRLPGYISFPSFHSRPDRIVDVSLVVRSSKKPREQTRQELSIPLNSKCILITFGGFNLKEDLLWNENRLPQNWMGVVCLPKVRATTANNITFIDSEKVYMPGK